MDVIKETFNKMIEGFLGLFSNIGKEFYKIKDILIKLLVIIVPIVLVIVIVSLTITSMRNSECADVRKKIGDNVEAYVMGENLYPTINGDNVVIDLSLVDKVTFKDEECKGTVKITKVNDEYVKTFYLENCSYCDTKDFGKERDNYNKKASNIEVMVYYNYYNVTNNNSRWSDYIPFENISTEETMGVKLPLDSKDLPSISSEAIITGYEKEDKTFYSYKDTKWLWYQVNNNDYSELSSEKPAGYTNFDKKTETRTEYSEWSLDYPEEKEYRTISSANGYRWYKMDGNNKVYWSNGDFYPKEPEEGYIQDKETKMTMYRYYDTMWKWYNGTPRGYYSYQTSTPPSSRYKYRDYDFTSQTEWSKYNVRQFLTSENSYYREEVPNVHSRYMIYYKVRSFLVLDEYLERTKFESEIGRTLEDIYNDINYDLDVKFKFKY